MVRVKCGLFTGLVLRFATSMLLALGLSASPLSAQTVIVNGFPMGGKLGVTLQDVTRKLAEREKLSVSEGAYVSGVSEESPAEKAGIEEGDVVVSFHGTPITDADDLRPCRGRRERTASAIASPRA